MVSSANSSVAPDECDRILQTLSNGLRRHTIRVFETDTLPEATTLESLAAELESCTRHQDRQQLKLELAHLHLPKLESRKWLEYDRRAGDILYTGHPRALPVLKHVQSMISGE